MKYLIKLYLIDLKSDTQWIVENARLSLEKFGVPIPEGTPEPPVKTSDEAMEELERAKKKLE